MKYALGIDLGSSSVKVALVEADSGKLISSAQHPKQEMPMISVHESWAEQNPEMWWEAFETCIASLSKDNDDKLAKVGQIGIAYQMHGLVCVDKNQKVIRPSIIWCDSRAVAIGEEAMHQLGNDYCMNCLLNSPGNFTASKVKWVSENEPENYKSIYKIMLPGDYISMKLTGEINTTITGLSEGIFWDFNKKSLSTELLGTLKIDAELLPSYKGSFSTHGRVHTDVAKTLGLSQDAEITYKAGDQPNNALSLNVLEPGEVAATAGTSGVVYAVVDELFVDNEQRVNSFAHVNYGIDHQRLGVLLCINGVGIANAWVKKQFCFADYASMNESASNIAVGSEGLFFFPFGNGAERMLGNKSLGASVEGLNYNIHGREHFARAVQEGIAFAFCFGMEAFKEREVELKKIKAGYANMFLSPIFSQIIADLMQVEIELFNTDGAIGAARGALIGGKVLDVKKAFTHLEVLKTIIPRKDTPYMEIYTSWKEKLLNKLNQ